jgi:NAD/NADP transhydrogenase alpha subunit
VPCCCTQLHVGHHHFRDLAIGSRVVTGALQLLSTVLGTIAVACPPTNVVGGFLITDRMLRMFKRRRTRRRRGRR